jgi:uncharacterized membrane protein
MEFVNRVVTALVKLHPWHSLIVHFPIALSTVGLFFVLLALWRRSELYEKFAFFNVILAAISTAFAGLAGLRDNIVHFEGNAPYMNIKIFLGSSLLLLASVTALVRRRNAELLWNPSTRILYVAAYVGCFLLVAVLGFVGGAILYGF